MKPLKLGLDVNLLNEALRSQTDNSLEKSLCDARRKLIVAIDDYKGEDPLKPWIERAKPLEKLEATYKKFLVRSTRKKTVSDEDSLRRTLTFSERK